MKYFLVFLKRIFSVIILIVLIAWVLFTAGIGNKSFEYKNGFSHLNLDGRGIRIFQKGNGKDVLFVHGTPGSIEDWKYQIDALSGQYRVTAFDRPGHGYSSPENYDYHLEENAALIRELINHLELKDPLLVGHSYGGSSLANFATSEKNVEYDIVIIDSPLYNYEPTIIYRCLSLPFVGKALALLANYTIAKGQIENGIKEVLSNTSDDQLNQITKERTTIWLQPKVLYSKSNESIHYQGDLDKISKKYSSIKSKITLITGEENQGNFSMDSKKFKEDLPSCELKIIKNTGHYIQLEAHDKVNFILQELLEEKSNSRQAK